jgi:cell division septation protein DedD
MTRLICARCRYECQTELQRIICPRCASIIDTPAEPPGAPEPLELEQNQEFAYVEEDLSSAQGLAATGAVLEPEPNLSPNLSPDLSPDLSDEVLDLPESSQPIHSYNPAFAGVDSDEDEVVFEEPARVTTRVAPNQNTTLNPPRVIRLSEPRVVPANPEPMYFVPKQRLAILQGRSWRGPAIVAAIAVAGFGLYSLQGRTSPSTHPATAARKTSSTPAPGLSPAASAAPSAAPSPSVSKASSTPSVKATVIPAAKIPISTPSPVPVKSRKPAEELAKADKKPVAEPKKKDSDAVPIPKDCKLTVQVASFPSEEEAKERVGYLKSVGVLAEVVKADLGKRGTYFRVMTGRFLKQVDARKYGQQLLSKGKVQEFVVAARQ